MPPDNVSQNQKHLLSNLYHCQSPNIVYTEVGTYHLFQLFVNNTEIRNRICPASMNKRE